MLKLHITEMGEWPPILAEPFFHLYIIVKELIIPQETMS